MIRFDRVSKRYPSGQQALQNISFELNRGEFTFLTGHSGAGKSTLLKLVLGLDKPSAGIISVAGQNIVQLTPEKTAARRRIIGAVFQDQQLLSDRTVFDNVALPLEISGCSQRELKSRVRAALDKVGLLRVEKAMPSGLSGGQQQRIGIARAIVNSPSIILADEPTGNLDDTLSNEIMGLFTQFRSLGVCVLVASHDKHLIDRFSQRTLVLKEGNLIADSPGGQGETTGAKEQTKQ